jgi:hypothetical protein
MRITKNNLVWYFIRPEEELPASYVKHVKKFLKSIGEKNVASSKILRRNEEGNAWSWSVKRQATSMKGEQSSDKHQASSDKQQASEQHNGLRSMKPGPFWLYGYKHQATAPGIQIQSSDYSQRATNCRNDMTQRQASSYKHPESGFKQQASSAKQ